MAIILLIYEREQHSASFNSNKEKNYKTEATGRLFCCCLGKPQQLHPRELFVGEKDPQIGNHGRNRMPEIPSHPRE